MVMRGAVTSSLRIVLITPRAQTSAAAAVQAAQGVPCVLGQAGLGGPGGQFRQRPPGLRGAGVCQRASTARILQRAEAARPVPPVPASLSVSPAVGTTRRMKREQSCKRTTGVVKGSGRVKSVTGIDCEATAIGCGGALICYSRSGLIYCSAAQPPGTVRSASRLRDERHVHHSHLSMRQAVSCQG